MIKYVIILILFLFSCKKEENPTTVELFIPTSFTPNRDNLNEVFSIRYTPPGELSAFEIKIYSTSQKLVFESNNIKVGWDGTNMNTGNRYPQGTYSYLIKYSDIHQNTNYKSGNILLLR